MHFAQAFGWFSALWEDLEPMPNTSERQLDYMEKSDLYDEFVADVRSSGAAVDGIMGIAGWSTVWKQQC